MNASERPSVNEACRFLADYAAWLLGCGATCIRIEKNVRRMSEAFGLQTELAVMPRHIHLSVRGSREPVACAELQRQRPAGISFDLNTRLSRLSWEVADGKVGFAEACRQLDAMPQVRPVSPSLVLLLASVANASFCRLFGGDAVAMLLVFAATLAGYRLKQALLASGVDVRLVFVASAFLSSVLAAGGHVFGWGTTPEVALGTSVLYLIPGIPYINSVSDLLGGYYLCAFCRLADAAVLTACLSLGLCCGLLLMERNLL